MGRTGSGWCPRINFGIGGGEILGFATGEEFVSDMLLLKHVLRMGGALNLFMLMNGGTLRC